MKSLKILAVFATATFLFGCNQNTPPATPPPAAEAPPPELPPAEPPPPEPAPAPAK